MTRYKHQPCEARDPVTGLVNADHVLTAGALVDKRQRDWGEGSDTRHRVRRQPDWYYDATEPLKRGHAGEAARLPRDGWRVGSVREGRDWTNKNTPLRPINRSLQAGRPYHTNTGGCRGIRVGDEPVALLYLLAPAR